MTTDSRGLPRHLVLHDHQFEVVAIQDLWRIDNDWWRPQPISRLYYEVVLNSGLLYTIYCDLITEAWYSQHY